MRALKAIVAVIAAASLGGCAAVNLKDLEPLSSTVKACTTGMVGAPAFAYVLPPSAVPPVVGGAGGGSPTVSSFANFKSHIETGANSRLPSALQNDPVVKAMRGIMIKTSAQSQLVAVRALGAPVPSGESEAVEKFDVPSKLTHGELKKFAKTMLDFGLRPQIEQQPSDPVLVGSVVGPGSTKAGFTTAGGAKGNMFSKYFVDYYNGKFVDRFGKKITKPEIALTITDAEIASALTVLLEYTVDLVDPTPVLGDDMAEANAKKFFPGGGTDKPTALVTGLAAYKYLPLTGCGLNQDNIKILVAVANAAGDRAGALGGLVSQSFGGIELGLGVLGKLSIGDNQMLATIVKTAASQLATRATLAASYEVLKNADSKDVSFQFTGSTVP